MYVSIGKCACQKICIFFYSTFEYIYIVLHLITFEINYIVMQCMGYYEL